MRLYIVHWLEGYVRSDLAGFLAPSWFMCVGFAGLVSLVLMSVLGRRRGMDTATIASAVLWAYVAAVLAGILVPMVLDGAKHFAMTGRFHLRWAGMTSFWGYLAGAAAVALVCRRDGVSLSRMADLAAVPLGVALVFARLGCFMAGCDYGKITTLRWAVQFPAGSPAWRDHLHAGLISADTAVSLPVHPTQLYEALLGLVIVAIAIAAARRERRDGQLFMFAAATYAIGRIVIETVRGDADRGVYAGVSSAQIFSLLVLLAIAARVVATRRRAAKAFAVAVTLLVIGVAGEADAQPAPPPPQPAQVSQPPSQPPPPPVPAPSGSLDVADHATYSTGALFGIATPLNRRAGEVPMLAGPSISLGYAPGRFGIWLDLDSYASNEATHNTLLLSGSFTQQLTRRLAIGGRLGIGATEVSFAAPGFRGVGGTTVRLEATAEIALTRSWALWVRPLTIDALTAADLGGAITTYQLRVGVAYRFGARPRAIPAPPGQPPPPPVALPPPPSPYPSLEPDPAPAPAPGAAAAMTESP